MNFRAFVCVKSAQTIVKMGDEVHGLCSSRWLYPTPRAIQMIIKTKEMREKQFA